MTIAYTSGDHSIATAVSLPEFTAPFEGVNIDYVLTQDFQQLKASYVSTALNTAHPTEADFILVSEGPRKDISGNRWQWTRTYAKVPATYSQPQSTTYNFIGFYGTFGVGVTTATGRSRENLTVSARVQYDYFLTGIGGTYATPYLIPIIQETRYYAAFTGATVNNTFTDYIGYSQSAAVPQLAYPVPPALTAYPSREVYEGWITAGTEIVAQASQVRRWMGNIIERETIYTKAR